MTDDSEIEARRAELDTREATERLAALRPAATADREILRPIPGSLINEDELIDRIVQEIEGDQIILEGAEWHVADTADANEIVITELLDDGGTGRRLSVRINVEVSEA